MSLTVATSVTHSSPSTPSFTVHVSDDIDVSLASHQHVDGDDDDELDEAHDHFPTHSPSRSHSPSSASSSSSSSSRSRTPSPSSPSSSSSSLLSRSPLSYVPDQLVGVPAPTKQQNTGPVASTSRLFSFHPPVLHFPTPPPNSVATQSFSIRNITNSLQFIMVMGVEGKGFSMAPSPPSHKLPPGLAVTLKVAYSGAADAFSQGHILLRSREGNLRVSMFAYPVLDAQAAQQIMPLPSLIDLGCCVVGHRVSRRFTVPNTSATHFEYRLRALDHGPFQVFPQQGLIAPGDKAELVIDFVPTRAITCHMQLSVDTSQFGFKPYVVTLVGNALQQEASEYTDFKQNESQRVVTKISKPPSATANNNKHQVKRQSHPASARPRSQPASLPPLPSFLSHSSTQHILMAGEKKNVKAIKAQHLEDINMFSNKTKHKPLAEFGGESIAPYVDVDFQGGDADSREFHFRRGVTLLQQEETSVAINPTRQRKGHLVMSDEQRRDIEKTRLEQQLLEKYEERQQQRSLYQAPPPKSDARVIYSSFSPDLPSIDIAAEFSHALPAFTAVPAAQWSSRTRLVERFIKAVNTLTIRTRVDERIEMVKAFVTASAAATTAQSSASTLTDVHYPRMEELLHLFPLHTNTLQIAPARVEPSSTVVRTPAPLQQLDTPLHVPLLRETPSAPADMMALPAAVPENFTFPQPVLDIRSSGWDEQWLKGMTGAPEGEAVESVEPAPTAAPPAHVTPLNHVAQTTLMASCLTSGTATASPSPAATTSLPSAPAADASSALVAAPTASPRPQTSSHALVMPQELRKGVALPHTFDTPRNINIFIHYIKMTETDTAHAFRAHYSTCFTPEPPTLSSAASSPSTYSYLSSSPLLASLMMLPPYHSSLWRPLRHCFSTALRTPATPPLNSTQQLASTQVVEHSTKSDKKHTSKQTKTKKANKSSDATDDLSATDASEFDFKPTIPTHEDAIKLLDYTLSVDAPAASSQLTSPSHASHSPSSSSTASFTSLPASFALPPTVFAAQPIFSSEIEAILNMAKQQEENDRKIKEEQERKRKEQEDEEEKKKSEHESGKKSSRKDKDKERREKVDRDADSKETDSSITSSPAARHRSKGSSSSAATTIVNAIPRRDYTTTMRIGEHTLPTGESGVQTCAANTSNALANSHTLATTAIPHSYPSCHQLALLSLSLQHTLCQTTHELACIQSNGKHIKFIKYLQRDKQRPSEHDSSTLASPASLTSPTPTGAANTFNFPATLSSFGKLSPLDAMLWSTRTSEGQ